MPKFCHQCGKELEDNSKFCLFCGAMLDPISETFSPEFPSLRYSIKTPFMYCIIKSELLGLIILYSSNLTNPILRCGSSGARNSNR